MEDPWRAMTLLRAQSRFEFSLRIVWGPRRVGTRASISPPIRPTPRRVPLRPATIASVLRPWHVAREIRHRAAAMGPVDASAAQYVPWPSIFLVSVDALPFCLGSGMNWPVGHAACGCEVAYRRRCGRCRSGYGGRILGLILDLVMKSVRDPLLQTSVRGQVTGHALPGLPGLPDRGLPQEADPFCRVSWPGHAVGRGGDATPRLRNPSRASRFGIERAISYGSGSGRPTWRLYRVTGYAIPTASRRV